MTWRGLSLHDLRPDWLTAAIGLETQNGNRLALGFSLAEADGLQVIRELAGDPLAMPLMLEGDGGQPLALLCNGNVSLRNQSAYLLALLAADCPPEAIALYVRHLFWCHPLHRLYTHLPAVPALSAQLDCYQAAGFALEGALPEHLETSDGRAAVWTLGILRGDLEELMRDRWPELRLP